MVAANGADLWLRTETGDIGHDGERFRVVLRRQGQSTIVRARHLVVATGGKSIPKMGASGLAYQLARQFGHEVTQTRPALVPLTVTDASLAGLAGVALPVRARAERGPAFDEAMLFTHRGLSGPAILQVSSYWREGEEIEIDLLPGRDLGARLRAVRKASGKRQVATVLGEHLPNRLADYLTGALGLSGTIADQSDAAIDAITAALSAWRLRPAASEGYRTAEVTLGGVDTDGLSSTTMMSKTVDGLYFIGECVDVTGWLGGYNFQWAWSSAHAAGRAIAARLT
jgi:predicted Rossmann fold flavoprotein